MSTRTTRPTGTCVVGSASNAVDEWVDNPTVNDSKHDTAPHDLSGVARALATGAPTGDHETVLRMAFDEGTEETIRALYVVMRRKRLTQPEMDNIVLLLRQEIVRL
jgi:hypothetical protein